MIGKLLIHKPCNRGAFKEVLKNLCRKLKGLLIQEIGADVFLFSFETEADRKWVIDLEPWRFGEAFVGFKRD